MARPAICLRIRGIRDCDKDINDGLGGQAKRECRPNALDFGQFPIAASNPDLALIMGVAAAAAGATHFINNPTTAMLHQYNLEQERNHEKNISTLMSGHI